MTAPLPPLPAFTDGYDKSEMIAFAKLAVREALERAIERIRQRDKDGYPLMGSAKAALVVRAMLKEYE